MNQIARRANHLRARGIRPALILLTDRHRLPDPVAALRHLCPGDWVIVRDYDHPSRREHVRMLVAECRKRRIRCLVAGDLRLATATQAHGVHVPSWHRAAVRRPYPAFRVSQAFHSLGDMRRWRTLNPDIALISPLFSTRSHPGEWPLGLVRGRFLLRAPGKRKALLGGIGEANTRLLPLSAMAGIGLFGGDD